MKFFVVATALAVAVSSVNGFKCVQDDSGDINQGSATTAIDDPTDCSSGDDLCVYYTDYSSTTGNYVTKYMCTNKDDLEDDTGLEYDKDNMCGAHINGDTDVCVCDSTGCNDEKMCDCMMWYKDNMPCDATAAYALPALLLAALAAKLAF